MSREVESCPHREPCPTQGLGLADCGLLRQLSGVETGPWTLVGRDACEICVNEAPASQAGLNPALASLLYRLVGRAMTSGGLPGCSIDQAERLSRLAEADLALVGSDRLVNRHQVRRHPPQVSKIGLIGWNTPSGLGQLNRDLARHLPIDRWLIPPHPVFSEVREQPRCPVWRGIEPVDLETFLEGLDSLIFCELPYLPSIVPMARDRKIRVALVPMWEYLDEMAPWLRQVDLMICPTRVCEDVVIRCRERLGLAWEVERIDWPIDLDQFCYRHREVCERFLFVNGVGGARESGCLRPVWDGRKGVGILADAARMAPEIPILVRSQTRSLPDFPKNVEVRVADLENSADLYTEGDVCIQPSRWEGLGLPMLECQASGIPLVTTDGPPMNEHRPFRLLASNVSSVRLFAGRSIPAREVAPAEVVRVMRELWKSRIGDASREARRFVASEHSWESASSRLMQWL